MAFSLRTYRFKGASEKVRVELLKASPGDRRVVVDALIQGINLQTGLGGRGESALCTLAGGAQTTQGTLVDAQVLLVLALELLHEMVDHAVVEVLAAQVGVSGGRLDLEDAILDGQNGHVKGSTAQVENENVALTLGLQKNNFRGTVEFYGLVFLPSYQDHMRLRPLWAR